MTLETTNGPGRRAARLRPVSIADALTEALRQSILDGDLPGGALVAEVDVAEHYGVSRPTAKAAITALVHSGLLVREANRSAVVPTLDALDVQDLFFVRIPLEVHVVGAVIERALVPEDALVAVTELAAVPADAPHSRFVRADLGFHRALVASLGSPHLSRVFSDLEGEIHLSMVQSRYALGQRRIVAEHGAVFEAIRDGDAPSATKLMADHLRGACAALAKVLGAPRQLADGIEQPAQD